MRYVGTIRAHAPGLRPGEHGSSVGAAGAHEGAHPRSGGTPSLAEASGFTNAYESQWYCDGPRLECLRADEIVREVHLETENAVTIVKPPPRTAAPDPHAGTAIGHLNSDALTVQFGAYFER